MFRIHTFSFSLCILALTLLLVLLPHPSHASKIGSNPSTYDTVAEEGPFRFPYVEDMDTMDDSIADESQGGLSEGPQNVFTTYVIIDNSTHMKVSLYIPIILLLLIIFKEAYHIKNNLSTPSSKRTCMEDVLAFLWVLIVSILHNLALVQRALGNHTVSPNTLFIIWFIFTFLPLISLYIYRKKHPLR